MIIYSHHNILEVCGRYRAEDTSAHYKGLMSCLQQSSHKQGKVTLCGFFEASSLFLHFCFDHFLMFLLGL